MIQPNLGACPGGIRRTPRPTRTFTAATKMEAGGRLRGLPRPRRSRQRAARVLKKRRCAFSGKSRQRRDRLRRRRLRNRETSRARGGCSARFLERTRLWETCRRCLACLRAACPRPAPTSSGPPPTPRVLGRLSSGVSPSVTTRGRSGGGICQRPRPRRARQASRGREREKEEQTDTHIQSGIGARTLHRARTATRARAPPAARPAAVMRRRLPLASRSILTRYTPKP